MKKVVAYANCQAKNILRILAKHPVLSREYDFENPTILSNFALMQEGKGVPYHEIESADLFLYQPTADKHGVYATSEILKHCKPDCKRISFPYVYNYAFWEVLVFADGDYAVGHSAMRYAHLNHAPITRLKEQGLSFEKVSQMILEDKVDWEFAKRYADTQEILRQKESECDIKVSDFIDAHYKDSLLFYTQNHVALPLLSHIAKQAVTLLGQDPSLFPSDLPHPDYTPRNFLPEIPIGVAAFKHFGFTFLTSPPSPNTMGFIIEGARRIYNGNYYNK
jgi:hypothetical protein